MVSSILSLSVPVFSLLSVIVSSGAQSGRKQEPPRGQVPAEKGPQVGETAPELNLSFWIQKPDGAPLKLSEMKGKVVLITTFAYNCDTCLKAGIPVAVELHAANKDRGLEVISITLPTMTEKTLAVMKEKHVEHAVAGESPSGGACPYVKIPQNPITYYFLIGRNG